MDRLFLILWGVACVGLSVASLVDVRRNPRRALMLGGGSAVLAAVGVAVLAGGAS